MLENTRVAQTLTAEAELEFQLPTATPSETPEPSATPSATPTAVVVLPTATDTPFTTLQTVQPITQTAAAQQTLDAAQQATPTPTPTALPATGFADDVGVPGLLMMGLALIAVVFIARQLRTRTAS